MVDISRFRKLKNRYSSVDMIGTDYEILSNNKVTGWSVNFPIVQTCKPSKICSETCYGLTGPITWSNSLNKQARNYNWARSDPKGFSLKLEQEVRRKLSKDSSFFLRWNGVGDLFKESVTSLQILNSLVPELPIWCVTRIPEHVLPLKNLRNLWVHFSLDKDSLARRTKVEHITGGSMTNLFYSYQTDREEQIEGVPDGIGVLFFDRYKIPENSSIPTSHRSLCPLNTNTDIFNMCHSCRRCFNGEAVAASQGTLAER